MIISSFLANAAGTDIRIAVSDIGAGDKPSGGGLIDLIYAKKFFEREFGADDITVHWFFIKGAGPVINEAFANKQIDIAYLGDLASIIGRAGGLDTRVVAAAARGGNHYLAVRNGADIHSLADLKGKRVGLFRGTAAELSFITALRSQNIDEKLIKVINLDFPSASAALAAGQIDATWGGSNALVLKDKGLADIAVSTKDLHGAGQLSGLVVVSGDFIGAHADLVRRLIKTQQRAAGWAADPAHRDEYIRLLASQSGYPEKILYIDLADMPPMAQLVSPDLDKGFTDALSQAVATAYNARIIRKSFSVNEWLDNRFLPNPN